MWKSGRVSVILICYNYERSIRQAIREFGLPEVDEIIVTDNNSTDGSVAEIRDAAEEDPRVRMVKVDRQGYGYSVQAGLAAATGDFLIHAPPNLTFRGEDIYKLLLYGEEFDGVFGTRTSTTMIWDGANMGPFLKYGNWVTAKMMEVLLGRPSLTDVGCGMRLIRRSLYERIRVFFTVGGSHFSPEMMFHMIRHGKVVEIPLHFRPRIGRPGLTSSTWTAFVIGVQMIVHIWYLWFRYVIFRMRAPSIGR
ncbi:MAG: glycosyltransferase family 2 protein [Candidatus Hydrogenedentota bacterium]